LGKHIRSRAGADGVSGSIEASRRRYRPQRRQRKTAQAMLGQFFGPTPWRPLAYSWGCRHAPRIYRVSRRGSESEGLRPSYSIPSWHSKFPCSCVSSEVPIQSTTPNPLGFDGVSPLRGSNSTIVRNPWNVQKNWLGSW